MTAWLSKINWELVAIFSSAIVGAVVGGIITYVLTGHLERVKRRDTGARLESALITEIIRHQFTFWRDLDAIFPLWLRRGEDAFWNGAQPRRQVTFQKLFVHLYQEFHHALLDSQLAAPIARYYRDIEILNAQAYEIQSGARTEVDTRIRLGLAVFEESLDLTRAMVATTPKKYVSTPQVVIAIADYRKYERRNRRLIAAAHRTRNDLEALKSTALQDGINTLTAPFNESDDWMRYLDWASRLH